MMNIWEGRKKQLVCEKEREKEGCGQSRTVTSDGSR